jgi:hypothetical protein
MENLFCVAGHVVGEVVPGVAVAAVVFADCSPLSLTEIAPFLPGEQLLMDFLQATMFLRHLWQGDLLEADFCATR